MPPHTHYVEPFAGGLRVLLAKDPEGVSEVANDRNRDLIDFYRVLRSDQDFPRFRRLVDLTPFHRLAWQEARDRLKQPPEGQCPVERAADFFTYVRQSLAGRGNAFTGITKTRTRRGMNNETSGWLSAVAGLEAVHERFGRVMFDCRPALDVIRRQDGPETLHYCDPPYLHETRTAKGVYGPHEMTEADHRELLRVLRSVRGKVVLSGYPSVLYDKALADWTCHRFDLANHAAGGRSKRRMTEIVWTNFPTTPCRRKAANGAVWDVTDQRVTAENGPGVA
jgi:DNA adenine methylase